jgi:hypothetical protein
MRPLLALLGLLALPLAAAGPITDGCYVGTTLCVDEYAYGEGSCDAGYEYRETRVWVGGSFTFEASKWCSAYEDSNPYESHYTYAWTPAGAVYTNSQTWGPGEDEHSCNTWYWIGDTYGEAPCAPGDPVDPGWGHLLP